MEWMDGWMDGSFCPRPAFACVKTRHMQECVPSLALPPSFRLPRASKSGFSPLVSLAFALV